MASTTTYIPRFLLPQYGSIWRSSIRTTAFARAPLKADIGQVLVRYTSKTATTTPKATTTTKKTTTPKTTTPKTATAKVAAPRAASTKATAATKSAAGKAAKASAPTKPPPKAPAKPATPKATTTKAATPKTPTSRPAIVKPAAAKSQPLASAPAAPAAAEPELPAAASKTAETEAPTPVVKPAAADPSRPIVLEKPERFNPPSHGTRLPRSVPKHYGGEMSVGEVKAQGERQYPGLPPPENTWSHWFINSRGVHLFITLGTLTGLAVYSFTASFRANSPFADMIPPISELPRHPFQYMGICVDVLRMHEEHLSAETAEKRRRKVEDVAKRNEYRKAHGMEPASGLWGTKTEEKATPEPAAAASAAAVVDSSEPEPSPASEFDAEGKRKKFFGIF